MCVDPIAIKALQNMLREIETLISTTVALPENRTAQCMELLAAAKVLTNDMMKRGSRMQQLIEAADTIGPRTRRVQRV